MYNVFRKSLKFTNHLYVGYILYHTHAHKFLRVFNLRYILILGYVIRGIYTFKTIKADNSSNKTICRKSTLS